jgi:hypothetical protein
VGISRPPLSTPAVVTRQLAGARLGARRLALASSATLGLCAALLTFTTTAGAVVSGGFGVQTRKIVGVNEAKPLQYHGGPVIPASVTYAIYWDPVGAFHSGWVNLIDRYLHDVGAASGSLGNIFSLNGQYTETGGVRASYESTFRGAYTDTQPYPANGCVEPNGQPVCLSDEQVRAELKRFIQANHLPTGIDVIYFLLTPPAVTVCTDNGGKGNCSDSSAERAEEEKGETGSPSATNGICGYHSVVEPGSASPIVYGVQPWIAGHAGHVIPRSVPVKTSPPTGATLACQNGQVLVEPNQKPEKEKPESFENGLADVIINGLSIEQDDIVVDPLLNGWYQNGSNAEQSDMCQQVFNPVSGEEIPKTPETTRALPISNETINGNPYYLQWALSSAGITSGKYTICWQGTELIPRFTATNPVNNSDIVAFDANESALSLDANITGLGPEEPYLAPSYKWEFGDGTPAVSGIAEASVFHTYQYGGVYQVTLTVTDSGGNTASTSQVITVVGPPPPGSGSGSPGTATPATPGSSSGATGSGLGQGAQPTIPGPAATQVVLTRSLAKILRKGLPVRYSVSEQVTGRFEVLLASAIARRAGIRGPLAAGLPKGSPPAVVIGKALLVTLKGGHNTVKIQFGKHTTERLRRLGKVTVTLRLIVRNAARSPQSTTVLSSVTLGR